MFAQTIVAIVFSSIIFSIGSLVAVSQVYTMFKTKNTSGTSLATYIIFLVTPIFSLAWGYLYFLSHMSTWWESTDLPLVVHQFAVVPMIAIYTLELIGAAVQVAIKARHIVLAKKYKVTELQLSKMMLSKFNNKRQQYCPLVLILVGMFVIVIGSAALLMVLTDPSINPSVVSPDETKMTPLIITFSFIGAATWEAMSWPQFAKCIKNKDTSGISLNWAIFMPISCLVCLIYAALLASVSGTFTLDTIGSLVFNGFIVNTGILVIKIINRRKAKQHGMSEIEYTRTYIHAKKKKRA